MRFLCHAPAFWMQYTPNSPQIWEVACVQRALRTKILSLAIAEPQKIIPFPQIL